MKDEKWAPCWLPLDTPPWRLVRCWNGSFLRGPDNKQMVFSTEAEALAFAAKNNLEITKGGTK